MTGSKKDFIKKYGAYLGFVSLIISIFTVPVTFYFAYRADYSSQVNSNFSPRIIEYDVVVDLTDISRKQLEAFDAAIAHGNFTVKLIVITPHAGIMSFTNKPSFNFIQDQQYPSEFHNSQYIINQNKYNQITVDEDDIYSNEYYAIRRAFVGDGITQINFTLPISAIFYPNSWVKNETGQFGTRLGNITSSISFVDIQTQQTVVTQLSPVEVWANFDMRK
jgi:hypothetical protein